MNSAGRRLCKILTATICMLIVTVSCASCSLMGLNDPAFASVKSAPEIVRLITSAVNDRSSISDSYAAIPEKQRGDVSFSYYTQYIDILRTLVRQGGNDKVTSFCILNEEDAGKATGLPAEYGCAELMFQTERDVPVYVVYEKDANGNPILSFEWISGIINIYNYAQHYFSMLDSRNTEGIFAILRPGFSGDIYTDEVVYSKAAALADFYFVKVKSITSQYIIDCLTPDQMEITIPEVLDDSNESMTSHDVILNRSGETYIITDSIVQEPDTQLSYLTDDSGYRLLRCGANYNYRNVVNSLGRPMNVSFNSRVIGLSEDGDGNIIELHTILVNYHGLTLVFRGSGEDRDNWDGRLVTMILRPGSEYHFGQGVSAGIGRSDLLVIYPYLEQIDYNMTYRNSFGGYQSVDFEISDDDIVSSIRVTDIS
ncbi:MAG: hypothetical protein J5685_01385 [Clostridiales bacterium]|nr:hypothetical protein [Clostridiales bacterium]